MDDVKIALNQIRGRSWEYRRCLDYYGGRHKLSFATEKFRTAFGSILSAFADNLCPSVSDALADRLRVIGFSADGGDEAAADAAWAIWTRNHMSRRSGEVHIDATTTGDGYVIVWPDADGKSTIYPNEATVMTVKYDFEAPGVITWAAKLWQMDDGRLRLNMYYSDRVEKYATDGKTDGVPEDSGKFKPFETDGESWPMVNPWGQVPVFHFANNGKIGGFGTSELRDVIPLQDALNKSVLDMMVAMEYVALPQRWATGLEIDIDEATGKPKPGFTPGADRVWAVGAPDARFGEFGAANLVQLLDVQDRFRAEIARVSGTPMHYLMLQTGAWPSGAAMQTAEARFLSKVTDRQDAFANVWEAVLEFALKIEGMADTSLSVLWKDPTPHNEKEMAEVALLKMQAGVSPQQAQRELGYSPQQIEQMAAETEAGGAALSETMLQNFERGQ